MLSAFSFGKLIKTFLPGSILTVGLYLFVEALWWVGKHGSIISILSEEKWRTVAVGLSLPVALLLGFLLNTWVWMRVNKAIKDPVIDEVDRSGYRALRQSLLKVRAEGLARITHEPDFASKGPEGFPRESLEYYFLPVVTLERLGFLWESYFSWYEFQINSAYAFIVTFFFGAVLLLVKPVTFWLKLVSAIALIVCGRLLFEALKAAARKNLLQYDRNLLILIASSLNHARENERRAGSR